MNSARLRRSVTRLRRAPKATGSSSNILIASDDRIRLATLANIFRETGYVTVVTDVKDILDSLWDHEDIELIILDMRRFRSRCALGLLLKWCFPRIPLVLIPVSVTDCLACSTCPSACHSATTNRRIAKSPVINEARRPPTKGGR
jgi:hypothetical protein